MAAINSIKTSLRECYNVLEDFHIDNKVIDLYIPEIKLAIICEDKLPKKHTDFFALNLHCKVFTLKNKYLQEENGSFIVIGKIFKFIQDNNLVVEKLVKFGIELKDHNEELNNKIDKILPYRNIDPKMSNLEHFYVLLKSKNYDEYIFIRGQERHIKNTLNHFKDYKIIIDKTKTPNPIDMINCIKEKIKKLNEKSFGPHLADFLKSEEYVNLKNSERKKIIKELKIKYSKITFNMNKIFLTDFEEEEFIKLVKEIDNEKYEI